MTLLNEGPDQLKPGDSVSLGLNLKINKRLTRDKGIPRDKIRFCLVKTKIGDEMIEQAVVNANLSENLVKAAGRGGEVTEAMRVVREAETALRAAVQAKSGGINDALKAKKAALEALVAAQGAALGGEAADLKQFLNAYQELNKRVIGKVASFARQGDRVEVILQPRNPY